MIAVLISVAPPLFSIFLALVTRRIIPSLIAGIFFGMSIFAYQTQSSFAVYAADAILKVLFNPDHVRIFLFSLLMGSFVCLLKRSGSVDAFLNWVIERKWIRTPKNAGLFAFFMGTILFLEGSLSILSVGTVAKPLFRKFRICNEKLAYICDASCAPIAVLIPLNGWGAYLILQLKGQEIANPVQLLIAAMPFFIYPMIAVILCLISIIFDWDFGYMKRCHQEADWAGAVDAESISAGGSSGQSASLFWAPVLTLIAMTFVAMFVTGEGSLIAGDGAQSVLFSVIAALVVCSILYVRSRLLTPAGILKASYDGIKDLAGIVVILFLAFLLNRICRDLETGVHLGSLIKDQFPVVFLPAFIFLLSSFMAFATGTSWGTFAIMIAVALPMAISLEVHPPLVLGAIVSGGVWGDHCSPVSDTTVLSALASGSDVIRHVRSQLPYAFLGGILSAAVFLGLSLVLV